MPYASSRGHRAILQVLRDGHKVPLPGRTFDSSYIDADTYGHKYVYPGMIIAIDTGSTYFVPYSTAGSYGTGSDTAVGILGEFHQMTMGPHSVRPFFHATAIEAQCYEYGVAVGTIATAIKTDLSLIKWI